MSITDFPLVWDVSSHQGEFDWDIALEQGVIGVYIRAGVGVLKDELFQRNWEEAGRIGIFRTSYWATWPELNWDDALNKWLEQHPEIENVERVIDFEHINGGDPAGCYEYFHNAVTEHDGIEPLCYSRTNILEPHLLDHFPIERLKLILAQYDTDICKEEDRAVVLPEGAEIDQVYMKQTAKIDIPGIGFVDHNRFIGDQNILDKWIEGCGEPPLVTVEIQEMLDKLARLTLANSEEIEELIRLTNINSLGIAELAKRLDTLQQGQEELSENGLGYEDRLDNISDISRSHTNSIRKLNTRIDGLAGGHNHPKWMRWLKLVKD